MSETIAEALASDTVFCARGIKCRALFCFSKGNSHRVNFVSSNNLGQSGKKIKNPWFSSSLSSMDFKTVFPEHEYHKNDTMMCILRLSLPCTVTQTARVYFSISMETAVTSGSCHSTCDRMGFQSPVLNGGFKEQFFIYVMCFSV